MQEKDIITEGIRKGDEKAFETAFRQYYGKMMKLACGILKNEEMAEEQVQEVFTKVWEKRTELPEKLNLFAYLLTSVRNRCYNAIRNRQVEQKYIDYTQSRFQEQLLNFDYDDLDEELIEKLHQAINALPEKCQEVFKLSRFERLSHKEISSKLDISVKTIEKHITKALKVLRSQLVGVLKILILLMGELL
ncbi:MAG: RNA polymerase sigma-70 factor [Bacteroidota bacterium]